MNTPDLFFTFISDIVFLFLRFHECGRLAQTCKTMHENSRRPEVFKRQFVLGPDTTNQDLIEFCANRPFINNLDLSRCRQLTYYISPFSNTNHLQTLHINGIGRSADISALSNLISLK